jgi:glutathionyl-hydroquinone reductase
MRTCPWLCVKQTLRELKTMRGLVRVVVSEVREQEQDGMELQEAEAAVLDVHVGMETDKRGPQMRIDLLPSVEAAMTTRQAVGEIVWSAHLVVLMV